VNSGIEADAIMYALRDDIRAARELGVQYVFVSTILPVAPENCGPPPPNCRGLFAEPDEITKANSRIRGMVPVEGGHLVDPWDLFVANRATYIDVDGLHLRPEGNRALAASFWERILQVVPASRLFGW
jgi:lysophospholipase L1-like esterase